MSTRPSFETEVEQSEQEPVEVRQLCAWEQETVLTTSGKRPKTHHPSAPFLSSKVFSQLWLYTDSDMPEPWVDDQPDMVFTSRAKQQSDTVPSTDHDCWKVSTGSMDSCLHWWICNWCHGQWRAWNPCAFSQCTDSKKSVPTGKHSPNYCAETALLQAASMSKTPKTLASMQSSSQMPSQSWKPTRTTNSLPSIKLSRKLLKADKETCSGS